MEIKDKMEYYEQLRNVPNEAQKSFDNGRFKGTDINPMWRIKRMTELFGPCGFGWYYEVVNRSLERSSDENVICAFIGINLYINVNGEWSKPIYGEGGNTMSVWNRKYSCIDTSDEAYKMALTDALSNATKQLGLGADIWFANDKKHSTKYDLQTERKADNDAAKDAPAKPAAPKEAEAQAPTEQKPTPKPAPAPQVAPTPTTPEQKQLYTAKTKAELRAMLTNNHWVADPKLVNYATLLAANLPD